MAARLLSRRPLIASTRPVFAPAFRAACLYSTTPKPPPSTAAARSTPPSEPDTHFGFQTVKESLKAGKGNQNHPPPPSCAAPKTNISNLHQKKNSRRSVFLRRLLIRCYERCHVFRYPPSLEGLLRPFPQSRPKARWPAHEHPRRRRRHRRHRIPDARPRRENQCRP